MAIDCRSSVLGVVEAGNHLHAVGIDTAGHRTLLVQGLDMMKKTSCCGKGKSEFDGDPMPYMEPFYPFPFKPIRR